MAKSFDAGLEMIEYQAKVLELLEGSAPQAQLSASDSGASGGSAVRLGGPVVSGSGVDPVNAAPAATNNILGPRKPCRVCGDLSLYGIHPFCERVEIERERAAMDREEIEEDEGAARGLDLGGSSGCAGGGCEEES